MTQTGPTGVNVREGGETKNRIKNEAFGERRRWLWVWEKCKEKGDVGESRKLVGERSVTSKAYALIALYSKGLSLCDLLAQELHSTGMFLLSLVGES